MREIKEEDFEAVAKFEIEISEISFGEKAITDLEFHCKKLVVLLFFGGRKIPELMKGIGKGVRSFKEGMNGMEKEISPENTDKKEE